ncbi:MAG: sulfide/dihydroorotate dehydrogenase-like FAD/NAD-binding protein [Deltaproteobacteria bacterium]|nr:sulfide/dihydroorotate dehydrogenase-like FAD/NAD-binding protein [Deltaproteobacteria bacterium]
MVTASRADLPGATPGPGPAGTIIETEALVPGLIHRMRFVAPAIARKRRAGQFILLRVDADGERIPLTIADADPNEGTLTIVWQVVGLTTSKLAQLRAGDRLLDVAGPLGLPTHIEPWGRVACVCGGIGTAPMYPIAQALRAAGNEVDTIIGARTKDLLILGGEMAQASDRVLFCTDDGSLGYHGFVSGLLDERIAAGERYGHVFAIGPVPMMKATVAVAKKHGIAATVSLNPVMVDGTGMCGGCRVTVNAETKFCCVDGPEFDGWGVDFDELQKRLASYREYERRALEAHDCRIGLGGR